MKNCNNCKIEKPLSEFYNNKSRKDGKQGNCKECSQAIVSAFTKIYAEHTKEYNQNYYQKNKKKIQERSRQYRLDNAEKMKENSKRFREKNPDYFKNYIKGKK